MKPQLRTRGHRQVRQPEPVGRLMALRFPEQPGEDSRRGRLVGTGLPQAASLPVTGLVPA